MSDFNGRIGEITDAFERSPHDVAGALLTIRRVLQAERADGWLGGYSDGSSDQRAQARADRERLAKEHENFTASLIARAPIEWSGEGTPGEIAARYVRALEAAFENAHGRLPVPGDYKPPVEDSAEGNGNG